MESTPTLNNRGARLARWAGIGSAITLFMSVFVLNVPPKATDKEMIDWWAKSGNRVSAIVSMYLLGVAAVLFLAVLGRIRASVVQKANASQQTSDFIFGVGIVYAASLVAAGVLRGAVGRAVEQHGESLPGVDILRYLPQIASGVFGVGAMGLATVLVLTITVVTWRSGAFPRWIGILGIIISLVSAAANVAGVGELSVPLFTVWLIAMSVVATRADVQTNSEPLVVSRTAAPGVSV